MSHRSIMQDLNGNTCYICRRQGPMEAHHALSGTANRRLAEEDGLIINLCQECHRKLHDKGCHEEEVKATAEHVWLRYYDKGIQEFIARYGKNYL